MIGDVRAEASFDDDAECLWTLHPDDEDPVDDEDEDDDLDWDDDEDWEDEEEPRRRPHEDWN